MDKSLLSLYETIRTIVVNEFGNGPLLNFDRCELNSVLKNVQHSNYSVIKASRELLYLCLSVGTNRPLIDLTDQVLCSVLGDDYPKTTITTKEDLDECTSRLNDGYRKLTESRTSTVLDNLEYSQSIDPLANIFGIVHTICAFENRFSCKKLTVPEKYACKEHKDRLVQLFDIDPVVQTYWGVPVNMFIAKRKVWKGRYLTIHPDKVGENGSDMNLMVEHCECLSKKDNYGGSKEGNSLKWGTLGRLCVESLYGCVPDRMSKMVIHLMTMVDQDVKTEDVPTVFEHIKTEYIRIYRLRGQSVRSYIDPDIHILLNYSTALENESATTPSTEGILSEVNSSDIETRNQTGYQPRETSRRLNSQPGESSRCFRHWSGGANRWFGQQTSRAPIVGGSGSNEEAFSTDCLVRDEYRSVFGGANSGLRNQSGETSRRFGGQLGGTRHVNMNVDRSGLVEAHRTDLYEDRFESGERVSVGAHRTDLFEDRSESGENVSVGAHRTDLYEDRFESGERVSVGAHRTDLYEDRFEPGENVSVEAHWTDSYEKRSESGEAHHLYEETPVTSDDSEPSRVRKATVFYSIPFAYMRDREKLLSMCKSNNGLQCPFDGCKVPVDLYRPRFMFDHYTDHIRNKGTVDEKKLVLPEVLSNSRRVANDKQLVGLVMKWFMLPCMISYCICCEPYGNEPQEICWFALDTVCKHHLDTMKDREDDKAQLLAKKGIRKPLKITNGNVSRSRRKKGDMRKRVHSQVDFVSRYREAAGADALHIYKCILGVLGELKSDSLPPQEKMVE